MGFQTLIGVLGFMGTLLLVLVGLLNFSVFRKQLRIAKEQIDTAVRQLEIAQKQPDLYLIQRAVTETSNHLLLFVERPKLRPYFYSEAEWKPGDEVSLDEIQAMAELVLNNFASALMHAAAFPEYPVRGVASVDVTVVPPLRRPSTGRRCGPPRRGADRAPRARGRVPARRRRHDRARARAAPRAP